MDFQSVHYNTRSLGENITLLHDILQTVKALPDIIAISESIIRKTVVQRLIFRVMFS